MGVRVNSSSPLHGRGWQFSFKSYQSLKLDQNDDRLLGQQGKHIFIRGKKDNITLGLKLFLQKICKYNVQHEIKNNQLYQKIK